MKIYLAGKIHAEDWRHVLTVPTTRHGGTNEQDAAYRLARKLPAALPEMVGGTTCTGPFFLAGDYHGMQHGPNSHGLDTHSPRGSIMTEAEGVAHRATVAARALDGIGRADHLFVWLDDPTAYGTLVEIGVAIGSGTSAHVYSPYDLDDMSGPLADLWFAAAAAGVSNRAHPDRAPGWKRAASPFVAMIDLLRWLGCAPTTEELADLAEWHAEWAEGKRHWFTDTWTLHSRRSDRQALDTLDFRAPA